MGSHSDRMDAMLDRATAAVRDETTPGPSPALAARTADRLATTAVAEHGGPFTRARVRRWSSWAVAASLLAAAGAWAFVALSSEPAFAQVIDAVRRATGLDVKATTSGAAGGSLDMRIEILGNKIRIETTANQYMAISGAGGSVDLSEGSLVMISDLDRGEMIELDTARKRAKLRTLEHQGMRGLVDPIEQLRNAKADDAELLGTELVDGVVANVYRMTNPDFLNMPGVPEVKVWVDPATHLPVRIVAADPDPKSEMMVTFREFNWQASPAPARFALDVPEGYTVVADEPATPTESAVEPGDVQLAAGAARLLAEERVPRSIAWSGDSRSLFAMMTDQETTPDAAMRSNELQQVRVDDGAVQWTVPSGGGNSLAASGDAALLATTMGREIQLRSADDGATLHRLVAKKLLPTLALSGDGQRLVSGVADWNAQRTGRTPAGGVEVWDVDAGALVRTLAVVGPVTHVAVSPDGRWIAAGSNLGVVQLWRADDGELARTFASQPRAAFSPDSRLLAVATLHNEGDAGQLRPCIELFDLDAGKTLGTLQLPDAAQNCLCLAFHPDGKALAAGMWEGQLCRWNLDDLSAPARVDAVGGGVLAAAYSPDGQWLATGSENRALQLWSTASGEE